MPEAMPTNRPALRFHVLREPGRRIRCRLRVQRWPVIADRWTLYMIRRTSSFLLVVFWMALVTSCSTERVVGKWRRPDERIEFRQDQTFVYTRGIQEINIRHQEVGGTYQLTDPHHIKFSIRYFGRPDNTNNVPGAGDYIWKVSVAKHTLTLTRPSDGYEQGWERE